MVALGTILHDIGLAASVSGPNRFEVNGADAALSFIKGKGVWDRRSQLIWDLVALNSTPSLALHKEPEVAVGTMGIGLDYGGFFMSELPGGELERILGAFPRLKMKQRFGDCADSADADSAASVQRGMRRRLRRVAVAL